MCFQGPDSTCDFKASDFLSFFFYHSHVDIFNPFSGKTHKSAQAKMRLLYPDLKEDTSVDLW